MDQVRQCFLLLSVCFISCQLINADQTICCVPDEWEGHMFLDFGTVFIDSNTAYSYINGSVHIAYSIPLKKIYLGIKGVEQSPLIPKPTPMDAVMLYDFTKGIMYNVVNKECDKSQLDKNMTHQCVPSDADLLSYGRLGDETIDTSVSTYRYKADSDLPLQVTATVSIGGTASQPICNPVHVTYFTPSVNPDSGSLYTLDVLDIGPLHSTDVFKVPKQCL